MTDVFSKEKRSWIMGRIKSRVNRSTEKAFVAILREHKIKEIMYLTAQKCGIIAAKE